MYAKSMFDKTIFANNEFIEIQIFRIFSVYLKTAVSNISPIVITLSYILVTNYIFQMKTAILLCKFQNSKADYYYLICVNVYKYIFERIVYKLLNFMH